MVSSRLKFPVALRLSSAAAIEDNGFVSRGLALLLLEPVAWANWSPLRLGDFTYIKRQKRK
jgi:hypothetical protein